MNYPEGALRTLQEVRDLVYAAKVEDKESKIYLVDGHQGHIPSFSKVKVTAAACIVGSTLFLNLSSQDFTYDDNILLTGYNVGSSGRAKDRFLFTNYWLAWGHFTRLKQGIKIDQQESNQRLLGW